jgi:hypothetical protein
VLGVLPLQGFLWLEFVLNLFRFQTFGHRGEDLLVELYEWSLCFFPCAPSAAGSAELNLNWLWAAEELPRTRSPKDTEGRQDY